MKPIAYFLVVVFLLGCARGRYVDRDPSRLKSPPTDFSFNALFVGDSFCSYNFFEDHEEHPFDPYADHFDPIDAWWCAEASLLVYVPDEQFVRARLARAGIQGVDYVYRHGPATGPDTQFFVAACDDFVLVSFRGSEPNIADWVTNSKFVLTPFENGRVHSGFLQGLDEAWNEGGLGRRLERLYQENPERPVWFTGHSLGGAVATLAAARWFDAHTTATGAAYVFGMPHVGDRRFCRSVRFPLWRVIHKTDLIPLLPPSGGYADAGGLKWIGEDGRLKDEWNAKSVTPATNAKFLIANWRRGRWVWLPGDVVDHSPLYYAIYFYDRVVDEVD
ncbi:lipase family protein [bacterium]|nr:lipase family protein [bacterium]